MLSAVGHEVPSSQRATVSFSSASRRRAASAFAFFASCESLILFCFVI